MADTEPSQSFYTHDTALNDKNNPHVSIQSNTLPLELRNPIPSDAQALLQILSDERNIEHDESVAGLNHPLAIEAMMTTWLNYSDPLDRVNFVVVVEDKPVGISGMGHIGKESDGRRVGDAGVMLNPEARGRGYAYESLRMTIDHALRVLKLDEVTVGCRAANVAMRGLMDNKFGLSATEVEGKFSNECLYRIKKDEWLSHPQS